MWFFLLCIMVTISKRGVLFCRTGLPSSGDLWVIHLGTILTTVGKHVFEGVGRHKSRIFCLETALILSIHTHTHTHIRGRKCRPSHVVLSSVTFCPVQFFSFLFVPLGSDSVVLMYITRALVLQSKAKGGRVKQCFLFGKRDTLL